MTKPWHKFVAGKMYNRDEVVATCETHIQSGSLQNAPMRSSRLTIFLLLPVQATLIGCYSTVAMFRMNPKAWRSEARTNRSRSHTLLRLPKDNLLMCSYPLTRLSGGLYLCPLESTPSGKTIMYGEMSMPCLSATGKGRVERHPYVNHLKQGETWQDARLFLTRKSLLLSAGYVQTPEGSIPPVRLPLARQVAEGASLAVWTDTWCGGYRAVFMSPDLRCVPLTGQVPQDAPED